MALLLTLSKSIAFHDESLRQDPVGNWRPALNPYGQRLSTQTVGIVGLGRIGTAAALRLKAFDMDVQFFDPFKPNGYELALGIKRVDSLETLMATSDIVTLHLPLSETHHLIDASVLAAAKPGLILINTAREPIVDIDALYDGLKSNQILAAGLDVLPDEPANLEKPLIRAWKDGEDWLKHRLVITPHSAFFTPQSMFDIRNFSADRSQIPSNGSARELCQRTLAHPQAVIGRPRRIKPTNKKRGRCRVFCSINWRLALRFFPLFGLFNDVIRHIPRRRIVVAKLHRELTST